MNKAGFVHSTRGTKGGYCLARPADEITLSEIIKVLDVDVLSKHCESYTGCSTRACTRAAAASGR